MGEKNRTSTRIAESPLAFPKAHWSLIQRIRNGKSARILRPSVSSVVSAEQRKAQAKRMKAYWAAKKKSKSLTTAR